VRSSEARVTKPSHRSGGEMNASVSEETTEMQVCRVEGKSETVAGERRALEVSASER